MQRNQRQRKGLKDEAGKQYGRLQVIDLATDEKGHAKWNCLCSCGEPRIVRSDELRSGFAVACLLCTDKQRRVTKSPARPIPAISITWVAVRAQPAGSRLEAGFVMLWWGERLVAASDWIVVDATPGHVSPVLLQGLDTFLTRGMLLACHSHRDVEVWRRTCPNAFKRLPLSKYEHLPLARRLFSSVKEFASGDLLFQVLAASGSQPE